MLASRRAILGLLAIACLALSLSAHGAETPDLRRLPPVADEDETIAEQVLTPPPDRWEELATRC